MPNRSLLRLPVSLLPGFLFALVLVFPGTATFRSFAAAAKTPVANSPPWEQLGDGILEGISGLALVEHAPEKTVLLAVHDNKKAGQKRLSLVTRNKGSAAQSTTVAWPGDLPVDLEAICRLPGEERTFLALTSKGALFRLTLEQDNKAVRVVPNPKPLEGGLEYEALDVQRVAGKLVACWAERGDGNGDGVLHFAVFDPRTWEFEQPQTIKVRAPWPLVDQRHVSDLRLLTDGTVLATSASDSGDDGPFSGAIYIAGSIVLSNDRPHFLINSQPARLFVTTEHKIEALEIIPGADGGMVLGSDDENRGGAVYFVW
jgi:hypothetical protein